MMISKIQTAIVEQFGKSLVLRDCFNGKAEQLRHNAVYVLNPKETH